MCSRNVVTFMYGFHLKVRNTKVFNLTMVRIAQEISKFVHLEIRNKSSLHGILSTKSYKHEGYYVKG